MGLCEWGAWRTADDVLMLLAVIIGSPCLLVLCVAFLLSAHRVWPDILRRHRRAVHVMNTCAEQRELAKHRPKKE